MDSMMDGMWITGQICERDGLTPDFDLDIPPAYLAWSGAAKRLFCPHEECKG